MVWAFSLFYFLIQSAAVVSLVLAHRLYKTYRFSYLRNFVYFLIFMNAFGFLKIVGRFFLYVMLADAAGVPQVFSRIDAAVTFIAYPFLVVSTYFFYATLSSWVKQPVTRRFNLSFSAVELTVLVLVFLEMYQLIHAPSGHPVFAMMMFVFIASCGFFEFLGVWQLFRYRGAVDSAQQHFIGQMASYYLVVFIVFYVLKLGFWGPFVSRIAYPLMYCSMHLYPLYRLQLFLKEFVVQQSLLPLDEAWLEELFTAHRITPREQEIVRLLLQGRSNAQIESTLFISIRTVRNHVHSIYKKMGVQNRLEMTHRFQNGQHAL